MHYRNLPNPPTLFFFGDGVSGASLLYNHGIYLDLYSADISAARHADLLFVKSKPGGDNDLAAYCKREDIKHVLFGEFKDVLPTVQTIVEGKKTIPEIIAQ